MWASQKNGNTSFLSQKLSNSLPENFQTEIHFLGKLKINPRFDCRNCKKGKLVCTVSDDMQALYEKMEQSDVLIFGTPIYWFSPSTQRKLAMDRLRPFYGNRRLSGKKAA